MAPDPSVAATFKIRPFQESDAASIYDILLDAPEAALWPTQSYLKLAESPGGLLLVYEAHPANQLVGFLAARHAADEAEILNIAVHPKSRRKAIGSALLDAALAHFRLYTVIDVYLELRQSNHAAAALYFAHAFEISDRRKAYYKNPTEDAICMRKKLTGTSL